MKIPIELESSTEFTTRVARLVLRNDAIVYVDTSFLMWLTKIGRSSRKQLFDWLAANCPNRVHVPVWSAHEYLQHHVADTIVNDLTRKASELAGIAGKTYHYLRPFLDDLLTPEEINAKEQQVTARDALNKIHRLAETAKRWKEEYKIHAAEVIAFINTYVLDKTNVFKYMSEIEALSLGRFNGRMPPGFNDRRKKAQTVAGRDEDDNADVNIGSNSWGDLIFWKEILDHAAEISPGSVIILTNDRKNDWHLGGFGTDTIDVDLRKLNAKLKPVPCTHPMLSLEARITSGVSEIVILDAPYLGALLRSMEGDRVKEFVDVAIVPGPPSGSPEDLKREALLEEQLKERKSKEAEDAAARGVSFLDGPSMANSPAAFRRALYDSRGTPETGGPIEALLLDMETAIGAGESIASLLTQERVQGLNNSLLTMLSRELHDRGLARIASYDEALTDLVSGLDDLPELTAASIYLGLLASMYLERGSNKARLPPLSPIDNLLFERQGANYATQPISTLKTTFAKIDHWPLYLPDSDRPTLEVYLDIVPYSDEKVVLSSLRLAGQEVFTPAANEPDLQLSNIFGGRLEFLGSELVKSACKLFGVPFNQVVHIDNFERRFAVDETAGFKPLHSVYVDKEEAD